MKNVIGWTIRGLVTVGVLYYLFNKVEIKSILGYLKNADPIYFGFAVLALGLTQILLSLRWYILLDALDIKMKISRLLHITLVGQFFNAFLLGSTGGDLSKLVYCIKDQPNKKSAVLISILFDRFLGLVMILFVAVMMSVFTWEQWIDHIQTRNTIILITLLLCGLVFTCTTVILFPARFISARAKELFKRLPKHRSMGRFLIDLRSLRRQPSAIAKTLFVVFLTDILVVLIGHFSALSVGLDVSLSQSAVVMSMVLCAIALPISFGGHGIREYTFLHMYILFGVIQSGSTVGENMSVAVSFLFFATTLIWSLVGGVCFLLGPKMAKS